MLDLSKATVYNKEDRTVNIPATLAKVSAMSEEYNASRVNDLDKIAVVVDAIFAQYPGVSLTWETLKGFVARDLHASPRTYSLITERVESYVRSFENTRFLIKQGKGVSRLPAKTA